MNKRRAMSLGAAAALTLSIAAVPSPVIALDEVDSQALRNRVKFFLFGEQITAIRTTAYLLLIKSHEGKVFIFLKSPIGVRE